MIVKLMYLEQKKISYSLNLLNTQLEKNLFICSSIQNIFLVIILGTHLCNRNKSAHNHYDFNLKTFPFFLLRKKLFSLYLVSFSCFNFNFYFPSNIAHFLQTVKNIHLNLLMIFTMVH